MLKFVAPDGTATITTSLLVSLRVNAPPIANPVERFKDAKQVQFWRVAVPVNAAFCPSTITTVMVGGIVSGFKVEFMVPEKVPARALLCVAVHVPASP
jgi:hypothetical protein